MRRNLTLPSIIRWRLVIYGGIDFHVSLLTSSVHQITNQRLFLTAPWMLCNALDCHLVCRGVENISVSMFMLTHPLRGSGRGSVVVGRNVHNQRIERLWRDIFTGVISLYRDLFIHMENIGILDPTNELHLFCLRFIYHPRINDALDKWSKAWNLHALSEHGNSPSRLWTAGLHRTRSVGASVRQLSPSHFSDIESESNFSTLTRYCTLYVL